MVKPGGTGKPRLAISARLAPLPPSRSRISALPSALPSPKVNTHLPALARFWLGDGLLGTTLRADLAADLRAGLAALLLSALRAETDGAALGPARVEGFGFAWIF